MIEKIMLRIDQASVPVMAILVMGMCVGVLAMVAMIQ
jgi:hypothetical protein